MFRCQGGVTPPPPDANEPAEAAGEAPVARESCEVQAEAAGFGDDSGMGAFDGFGGAVGSVDGCSCDMAMSKRIRACSAISWSQK